MKYAITPILFFIIILSSLSASSQTFTYYNVSGKPTRAEEANFFSELIKTDSGYHRRDYFLSGKNLRMDGYYKDSTMKIREGRFCFFFPNKSPESVGTYTNNKKTGLWMSFYSNGILRDSTVFGEDGKPTGNSITWHRNGYPLDSSVTVPGGAGIHVGWFDNGKPSFAGRYSGEEKKHGKWVYYHRNGVVSAIEVYNDGKLEQSDYFNEGGIKEAAITDTTARYKGTIQGFRQYLNSNLRWPTRFQLAKNSTVSMVVEFDVDEEGKVQHVEITTPYAPAFDKVAQEVVSRSPRWQPAMHKNRRISAHFKLPIVFRYETRETYRQPAGR